MFENVLREEIVNWILLIFLEMIIMHFMMNRIFFSRGNMNEWLNDSFYFDAGGLK
jgi:hypothetical protein